MYFLNAASVSAALETLTSVVVSLYERLLLPLFVAASDKSSVVVSVKSFVVVLVVSAVFVPLLVTVSAGRLSVALNADLVVVVVAVGVSVILPALVVVPVLVVVLVPVLVLVAVVALSVFSVPLCVISRRAVPNGLNLAVTSNIAFKNGSCVSIIVCPAAAISSGDISPRIVR